MGERLSEIQRALDSFQMEEARALAQEEIDENPSAAAFYLASQAALNHGQRVEFLEKALELEPDFGPARDELADIAMPAAAEEAAAETSEKEKRAQSDAPPVKLAGLSNRFLAIMIDAFLVFIATFAVLAATDAFAPFTDALYSADELAASAAFNQFQSDTIAVNLLVSAVYNVAFMTLLNGQTPGKLALKLRVVKKNGRRISILDALLRNVFGYTVSQIFLLGYLWAIFDDEQQAWHDKMAGTVVVDERRALPR